MTSALSAPERAGSREQGRELFRQVPEDLTACVIVIDCSPLTVSTPSFWDEVIKVALVERHAKGLELVNVSERAALYATRSAANRAVSDGLKVRHVVAPRQRLRLRWRP